MTDQTLAQILEESRKLENAGKKQEAVDYLTNIIAEGGGDRHPLLPELLNQRGFVKRMMQDYKGAYADYFAAFMVCGLSLKVGKRAEEFHEVLDKTFGNYTGVEPKTIEETANKLAALDVALTDSEKATEERFTTAKANAFINIADVRRVGDGDAFKAHLALDGALKLAGHWTLLEAKAHDQRGMVFDYTEKKFPEAIKEYRLAQRICEDLLEQNPDDKDAQNRFGQVVLHLGYCYFETNDSALLPKAYDALNGALEIFQKHDDRQGIMNTVTSLGRLAMHHKDYEGALEQYQKATEILRETQHRGAICSLHLHYAEAYLAKGKEGRDQAFLHLEALRDGIKRGDMSTPSDAKALKERFASLNELYNAYEMKIDRFEEVQKFFA